jgi:hypothetical protein
MPQLVLIAALGVGVIAGYRWLKRASEAAAEEMARATRDRETAAARVRTGEKDMGQLEYDAATGVYRPARHD